MQHGIEWMTKTIRMIMIAIPIHASAFSNRWVAPILFLMAIATALAQCLESPMN